jgi:23S rRNA pseudouridine2605 synthase
MHPSHGVNKTYEVTVPGIVPEAKLDQLRMGVPLEDGMTAPAVVQLTQYDHGKNLTHFTVTIHEGRNRAGAADVRLHRLPRADAAAYQNGFPDLEGSRPGTVPRFESGRSAGIEESVWPL